jgi:hypothetical protein
LRLVYVAAPLSAPLARDRVWHRSRAVLIGRLVALNGELPVVPHVAVGGIFLDYPRRKEQAKDRYLAMGMCLRLVEVVALSGGRFRVLRRFDGSISEGCQLEMDRYHSLSTDSILATDWDDWSGDARKHGLFREWSELRDGP